MIGPVIGGPLYSIFGYFESFCCFGGLIVISLVVAVLITPSSLNGASSDEIKE